MYGRCEHLYSPFAQFEHCEVERNAENVHPERLVCAHNAEFGPVDNAFRACKNPYGGHDKGVYDYGEDAAYYHPCNVVSDNFARKVCEYCRQKGCKAAEEYIIHAVGGYEVCQHAAYVQSGHRFGKEEGHESHGLGGPYLEGAVGNDGAQAAGEYHVQRGNHARAAEHFGVPVRKIGCNTFE